SSPRVPLRHSRPATCRPPPEPNPAETLSPSQLEMGGTRHCAKPAERNRCATASPGGTEVRASLGRDPECSPRRRPACRLCRAVEHVGIQFGAVRPDNCFAVLVDRDLCERTRFAQRLEERTAEK